METTHLGGTGLTVSRLGLGTAALGRPGYINLGHAADLDGHRTVDGLRERAMDVMDAAHAAGITYLDTARSYGRAEEFVADWLAARSVAPGAIVVGSKWGYTYTAGWATDARVHEVKEHSRAKLDEQIVQSRDLLGDRLRLYQIHSATAAGGVLDDRGVLARLGELRDGGLHIGITVSGTGQAETITRAAAVEIGGRRLFDTVQATWNLLEPSAGPALAEAHTAGLGVIVKEAVGNGRLTARDPGFAAVTAEHGFGMAPDAVAIAAVFQRTPADVVLSGATTVDQLASNLDAFAVPEDVVAGLPDLAEPLERYWDVRSRLAWT